MIKDQPFGVGRGRFAFNFIPYQKKQLAVFYHEYFMSPHNEVLRIFAEYGILLGSLFLVGLGWFCFKLLRLGVRNPHQRSMINAVIGFLLVLIVQSLFQFPSENAGSMMFLALTLALLAMSILPKDNFEVRHPFVAATVLFIATFLGVSSAKNFYVDYLANEKGHWAHFAEKACRLDPRHLPVCTRYASHLRTHMRPDRAIEELTKVLR